MARIFASVLAAAAIAAGGPFGPVAEPAWAGALWLKSCTYFGDSGAATDVGGPVWEPQALPGEFSLADQCPLGGSFQITPSGQAIPNGANAQWHTITPPTIGITGAWTPFNQVLVLPGINNPVDGFAASYFWNGGTQTVWDSGTNCCGGMNYGVGINRNDLNYSRYFGFQVSCVASQGCGALNGGGQALDVRGIQLTAQDNTPPDVLALGSNLSYQNDNWVRGAWPISFQASDDSGVCSMSASVDGQVFQGPTASNNQSSWTQCPTPQTLDQTVDTVNYPNGPLALQLTAADAASPPNINSLNETLHVDNQPVTLQLTGPTDTLSTVGTQNVTASASAGPSGVAGIWCSVDGQRSAYYQGASAQIPVRGIGQHTVACSAQNRAIDAQRNPASSALESWSLSIRQPTVSGITFGARVLDALRCHRQNVWVTVPGRWVTVRRHGARIRVRRRAHTRLKRKVRCHPRFVIRKVRGPDGLGRRRIAILPHTVRLTAERVRLGRTASVSGWVGLADGTALTGVPMQVMTATDNGLGQWRVAAVVTTDAAGFWRASLGPGPSRLIAAVYPGSSTTEPATSGQVHLSVSTKVLLTIRPQVTRWGHTIRISGRVLGGNIPAGKLLRLRIGTAGVHSTVGIPGINRNGRYHTSWTFAPGHGVVRYWFSVTTLAEADYPYAESGSRRIYVTVEG